MVNNIHDKLWQNVGVSCNPNTISQTYNMGPVPRKSVFGVSIKVMLWMEFHETYTEYIRPYCGYSHEVLSGYLKYKRSNCF